MSNFDCRKNATIFYAPVWVGDYRAFIASLKNSEIFVPVDAEVSPQYLLPYAAKIYSNAELCSTFRVRDEHLPHMCMFKEYCKHSVSPVLESIKITCFGTGCAFVELYVTYDGLDATEIADFSFCFKNAVRSSKSEEINLSMYDILFGLLSSAYKTELFFTGNGFKKRVQNVPPYLYGRYFR